MFDAGSPKRPCSVTPGGMRWAGSGGEGNQEGDVCLPAASSCGCMANTTAIL